MITLLAFTMMDGWGMARDESGQNWLFSPAGRHAQAERQTAQSMGFEPESLRHDLFPSWEDMRSALTRERMTNVSSTQGHADAIAHDIVRRATRSSVRGYLDDVRRWIADGKRVAAARVLDVLETAESVLADATLADEVSRLRAA